jgi:hypothetical protein
MYERTGWRMRLLVQGQVRTRTRRYEPRSFRSSGPAVWNSLPLYIRDYNLSMEQFKQHLKQSFVLCGV